MKKLYFLFFSFLFSSLIYSQSTDLFFSKYGEGSSNNKFYEIYNGTGSAVDLSGYSVKLFTNGGTTATNTLTFTAGTTLANGDVYVVYNSSANVSITTNGDVANTTTNFNGDDALVLLKGANNLDIIGIVGNDPGTAWNVAGVTNATLDHTLTRKSTICSPTTDWAVSSGTTADDSQWVVTASDSQWSTIGSFTGCSTTPSLSINLPSNNQIFNPETTSVDVTLSVQNFVVANGTGNGYIKYTVDGGSSINKYDTTPINLTGLTAGNHMVYVELVNNAGAVLNPVVNATVNFSIASYTQVADLAALRSSVLNGYYQVTGVVVNTYSQAYRYQKWFQDATAGILVDDLAGIITTTYNEGDGISNLKGQLVSYNQLLQLIPTINPGTASSTENSITPVSLTIAALNSELTNYESELIKLSSVTISDFTGTGTPDGTFQASKNFPIADASGTSVLRTSFSLADYIGQTFPTTPADMICIVGNYNGTSQVTPRSLNDMVVLANKEYQIEGFSMYPNPAKNQLFIHTANSLTKNIEIFDVLGKQVVSKVVVGTTLDFNLPRGIYILKVEEAGKVATQKLVVE